RGIQEREAQHQRDGQAAERAPTRGLDEIGAAGAGEEREHERPAELIAIGDKKRDAGKKQMERDDRQRQPAPPAPIAAPRRAGDPDRRHYGERPAERQAVERQRRAGQGGVAGGSSRNERDSAP